MFLLLFVRLFLRLAKARIMLFWMYKMNVLFKGAETNDN